MTNATKTAKKNTKNTKAASKKATERKARSNVKSFEHGKVTLSGTQVRLLNAIVNSKTVCFPGVSKPGELTYKAASEEAGVSFSGLLVKLMSKASRNGVSYPDSLESQKLVTTHKHETDTASTPIVFSATAAGKAFITAAKKAGVI